MADQLTPLGVMLLALLREGDMHPYEMRRLLLERHDDLLVPTTTGAVYHGIGRLAQQGLAAEVGVDREGNRPERTTYTITDTGREAVTGWLRRQLTRADECSFRVALAESHNLGRDEVLNLLTIRRDDLQADVDEWSEGIHQARTRLVDEIYLIEVDRRLHLLRAELAWLNDLLNRLASGVLPWPDELSCPINSPAAAGAERTTR